MKNRSNSRASWLLCGVLHFRDQLDTDESHDRGRQIDTKTNRLSGCSGDLFALFLKTVEKRRIHNGTIDGED